MQMAVVLAGFSWSEADKLRKIIGKKRDAAGFDEYKEKFCNNEYLTRRQSEKTVTYPWLYLYQITIEV